MPVDIAEIACGARLRMSADKRIISRTGREKRGGSSVRSLRFEQHGSGSGTFYFTVPDRRIVPPDIPAETARLVRRCIRKFVFLHFPCPCGWICCHVTFQSGKILRAEPRSAPDDLRIFFHSRKISALHQDHGPGAGSIGRCRTCRFPEGREIIIEIILIAGQPQGNLFFVACAKRCVRFFYGGVQGRKKKSCKNCNDCNYNEEFYQCKIPRLMFHAFLPFIFRSVTESRSTRVTVEICL